MKISFKKREEPIENLTTWENLGGPKSKKQWEIGRSSYEMASFSIQRKDQLVTLVKNLLQEFELEEQDFVCEPEATASLGKGMFRGGCRNHDLLMVGKDVVISVEAKVSEKFGNYSISKEKERQTNDDAINTRAQKLIDFLASGEENCQIGYQLFSATRGTMSAAAKIGYKKCIQLVLIFEGNVKKENDYLNKCKKNDEDFKEFLKITKAANGDIKRTIEGQEVTCLIKKVKVQVP